MRHIEHYNFKKNRCKRLKNFGEVTVIPELLNVFKFAVSLELAGIPDPDIILTEIEVISDTKVIKSFKLYKRGYTVGKSSFSIEGLPNSALGLKTLKHPIMFYK